MGLQYLKSNLTSHLMASYNDWRSSKNGQSHHDQTRQSTYPKTPCWAKPSLAKQFDLVELLGLAKLPDLAKLEAWAELKEKAKRHGLAELKAKVELHGLAELKA